MVGQVRVVLSGAQGEGSGGADDGAHDDSGHGPMVTM